MQRSDGTIDDSGLGYILKIISTEFLVLVPSCIWAGVTYNRVRGKVSCNTRTELELVLLFIFVSSLCYLLMIAPCVIEKVSSGETYFRGLAEFHGTPLHGLVNMHIAFDYFILVYGSLAVVTTNLDLCSEILPKEVGDLLALHGIATFFRTLHHVVFPAVVRYFSERNPMLDIPDPNVAAGGELGNKLVSEREDAANRVRKLVDHNFHKVQQAYTYREKLPTLVDPNPPLKKKKELMSANGETTSKENKAIVVKPKREKNNQIVPLPV